MSKPIIGIGADVVKVRDIRDRAFAFLTYVESIRRAGAVPVVIPPQPENAADVIDRLDGILLAGGDDCHPAAYGEEPHPTLIPMDVRRQQNEIALARAARERGIPTLGVCLGMQMMNVGAGGSLIQDIASEIETDIQHASEPHNRVRHDVVIDEGTRLAGILPSTAVTVNSSHHQAIRRLGEGLRVNARARDGIVEGIEDPRHRFYVGIQWHPEEMLGEISADALFRAFVEEARAHAGEKEKTYEAI